MSLHLPWTLRHAVWIFGTMYNKCRKRIPRKGSDLFKAMQDLDAHLQHVPWNRREIQEILHRFSQAQLDEFATHEHSPSKYEPRSRWL